MTTTNPTIHQSTNPGLDSTNPCQAAPAAKRRKRNGFVAQLPKATRDQINQWIDDGKQYPQIIEDLGDAGKHLNAGHLTSWFQGGYQDHLAQQEWRLQLRCLRESGSDVPELAADHKFQEMLVQLGLTEIFRVLREGLLQPDSPNYIRLLNALARLNREALNLRKYNDSLAESAPPAQSRELPTKEDFERAMERSFELAIGIKPSPVPLGPDLNHYISSSSFSSSSSSSSSHPPQPHPPAEAGPASAQPRAASPAISVAVPLQSKTEIQNSKFNERFRPRTSPRERCPQCRSPLPPLLPSGERPSLWCNSCGEPLRPPGALIEYCPACKSLLPELKPDGARPLPSCPTCREPLPPPKPPAEH